MEGGGKRKEEEGREGEREREREKREREREKERKREREKKRKRKRKRKRGLAGHQASLCSRTAAATAKKTKPNKKPRRETGLGSLFFWRPVVMA